MSDYIPIQLRQRVAHRAHSICEYCLIHEEDTYFGCQVDHIISIKHGGKTVATNLAFACTFCNRFKGSDIGSLTLTSGTFTRFYNPRTDSWKNHFKLDGVRIEPRSEIGEVTERILQLNAVDRLLERSILAEIDRFPPKGALDFID